MEPRYRILAHTADTGIVAESPTLAGVFENAAYGMFDLMFELAGLDGTPRIEVRASGDTREDLLVDWLSTLLYEAEVGGLALCAFVVEEVEEGRLRGSAWGVPLEEAALRGPPIKAVTYHDVAVQPVGSGWRARVIFDV